MKTWEVRLILQFEKDRILGEFDTEQEAIDFVNGDRAKNFNAKPTYGNEVVWQSGFMYRRINYHPYNNISDDQYMIYDKTEFEKLPEGLWK